MKFCINPDSRFDRNGDVRTKSLSKEEKEQYEWDSYVFVCPLMSTELVISPCKTLVSAAFAEF